MLQSILQTVIFTRVTAIRKQARSLLPMHVWPSVTRVRSAGNITRNLR